MKLKKFDYGLAVMRLQPLHFGHTQLIDRMIAECNHPIIAIGSAQESRTYGNPFTYMERKRMVYSYYHSGQLDNGMVVPIQDIFNRGDWARYVLTEVERRCKNKIGVYYCGSDQDGGLFLKEGIRVRLTDRDSGIHKGWSASRVRNCILIGDDSWEQRVPKMLHKTIRRVYKGEEPTI